MNTWFNLSWQNYVLDKMAQHHIQPNLEGIQCWDKSLILLWAWPTRAPLSGEAPGKKSGHTMVSQCIIMCRGHITGSCCYLMQSGKSKQTLKCPAHALGHSNVNVLCSYRHFTDPPASPEGCWLPVDCNTSACPCRSCGCCETSQKGPHARPPAL